jgi:hypothetical protein
LDGPCSSQDSNLASCEDQIGILCTNARHAILNNNTGNVFSKPNIYINWCIISIDFKFEKSSSDLNHVTIGAKDSNGILYAIERSLLVSCKEQQHPEHAFLSGRSSYWRSGFQLSARQLAPRKPGIRQ